MILGKLLNILPYKKVLLLVFPKTSCLAYSSANGSLSRPLVRLQGECIRCRCLRFDWRCFSFLFGSQSPQFLVLLCYFLCVVADSEVVGRIEVVQKTEINGAYTIGLAWYGRNKTPIDSDRVCTYLRIACGTKLIWKTSNGKVVSNAGRRSRELIRTIASVSGTPIFVETKRSFR